MGRGLLCCLPHDDMEAWDVEGSLKDAVREYALGLPGAWEDHPWGESAIKVGKKVFAFLGVPGAGFGMGVKLPESAGALLSMPFARPAGYGLGRSGWVEMTFAEDDAGRASARAAAGVRRGELSRRRAEDAREEAGRAGRVGA